MENKEEKQKAGWSKWLVIYILAGLIHVAAQRFVHSTVDQFIVIIIAILGAYSFYRVDKKYNPVKWATFKRALMFLGIWLLCAFVIGFSTAIADRWQEVAVRTPLGADIAKKDGETLTQLSHDLQPYLTGFQGQWDAAQNSIDENTNLRATYSANVSSYRTLLTLNNERYARFVSYSEQVKSILSKYSSNLMDAFSQMATAAENTKNAYNDIFETKVSYYQSLLNGESEASISNKLSASNDAIDRFNQEQQTAAQAQSNWQKAYKDFFGS